MSLELVRVSSREHYLLHKKGGNATKYFVPTDFVVRFMEVLPYGGGLSTAYADAPVIYLSNDLLQYLKELTSFSFDYPLMSRMFEYTLTNRRQHRVPPKDIDVLRRHRNLSHYFQENLHTIDSEYDFILDFMYQSLYAVSTFDTRSKYEEYKGNTVDLTSLGKTDLQLLRLVIQFICTDYRTELLNYELTYIYAVAYLHRSYPVDCLASNYNRSTHFVSRLYRA